MKECNSCGKCCVKYGNGDLSASKADIELWEVDRPEVFNYVSDGKIWVDPASGKTLDHCPWLQKDPFRNHYTCAIYFDRPEDCRVYPVHVSDMIKDQCEMLEAKDLKNLAHAQHTLELKYKD